MSVAAANPILLDAMKERDAEYRVIFGTPSGNGLSDSANYALLDTMRQSFSHQQLMSGLMRIPSGLGFLGTLGQAANAVGQVVKAAAPFIGLIPGIGIVAGAALEFSGSLASGDRIDAVVVNTVRQALPVQLQPDYQRAVDLGYKIARGQPIGSASIDLARNEVSSKGGPAATAAFDAGIAIGTAQGLQEGGYALFRNWVTNTDTEAARILEFSDDVRQAAVAGVSVKDFMLGQARRAFFAAVPAAQQADVLAQAIDFLIHHPGEMVDARTADLAMRLGIPIEAMRAAMMCVLKMQDGSLIVDQTIAPAFAPLTVVASIGRMDSAGFAARNADLQIQGAAIAAANPEIGALRNVTTYPPQITTNAEWRRGFDIGTAISQGSSVAGPGQDAVRSSIPTISQYNGFNAARKQQYAITEAKKQAVIYSATHKDTIMSNVASSIGRLGGNTAEERAANEARAARGKAMAAADPRIAAARSTSSDSMFALGFDVATALCEGSSMGGSGQTAVRNSLNAGAAGYSGFDVGQAVQFGITKARAAGINTSPNPNVAAGQLVASGVAGNGQSIDQKTATLTTVATDPQARQGIATVVGPVNGLWHRFLAFFGLV